MTIECPCGATLTLPERTEWNPPINKMQARMRERMGHRDVDTTDPQAREFAAEHHTHGTLQARQQ